MPEKTERVATDIEVEAPELLVLYRGQAAKLTATVVDQNGEAMNVPVIWHPRRHSIISVSQDGRVMAEGDVEKDTDVVISAQYFDLRRDVTITVRPRARQPEVFEEASPEHFGAVAEPLPDDDGA